MQKTAISFLSVFLFGTLFLSAQTDQDSTGLLGDNFSLEAALSVFKESKSLEDFEKRINQEDNYVNNLDLNDDGEVDFVQVIDVMESDQHAIILRIDLNKNESQDIAVIEIEKNGEESAILQIVGDEELYGPEKYVEPFELESNSSGNGPSANNASYTKIVVNVWFWPSVRFIYGPSYTVYVSPWRWAYYPSYWKPWKLHPWRYHYNKRKHTHLHFHTVSVHRVAHVHKIYTPKRKVSKTVVHKRSNTKLVRKTSVSKQNPRNKKAAAAKSKKNSSSAKRMKTNNKKAAGKKSAKRVKKKKN